jgi:hypothetical protein
VYELRTDAPCDAKLSLPPPDCDAVSQLLVEPVRGSSMYAWAGKPATEAYRI